MAIAPDGSLILACPNFANPAMPACLNENHFRETDFQMDRCTGTARNRYRLPHGNCI